MRERSSRFRLCSGMANLYFAGAVVHPAFGTMLVPAASSHNAFDYRRFRALPLGSPEHALLTAAACRRLPWSTFIPVVALLRASRPTALLSLSQYVKETAILSFASSFAFAIFQTFRRSSNMCGAMARACIWLPLTLRVDLSPHI